MANNQIGITKYTSQNIDNLSFDDTYKVKVVLPLELNPAGTVDIKVTGNLALKYVVSGTIVYVGEAAIGSATSAALWRVFKFDSSTGQITWADGNASFDNVYDNYASLSYS